MNAKKLLSLVALTLLATGCGQTTPTESTKPTETAKQTETAKPTEVPVTEEPVTTEHVTTEPTTEEAPVEKGLDLSAVQTGFELKCTMNEQTEYGTTVDTYKAMVGDDVLVYDDYYASTENKQGWDAEGLYLKARTQYEKHDMTETEKGIFTKVTSDLAGKPVYTEQKLKDPISSEDISVTFEDAFAVNAFKFLKAEDFVKNEDGTYALTITDEKKNDETFAKGYYGLNHQICPILSGNHDGTKMQFKLNSLDITSFVLTVDENGLPTSFTAKFKDEDKWGSLTKRTLTGEIVKTGTDSAEKYVEPAAKYEELDNKIKGLQAGNFSFTMKVGFYEDSPWPSTTPSTMFANGTFDASVLTLAGYKNGKEVKEFYKVTSKDHYRAFAKNSGKYVFSGDEVDESDTNNKLIPTFAFSSNSFVRVAASENSSDVNVYSFNKPLLFSGTPYTSTFIGYKSANLLTQLDSTLLVTTTADTISFEFTYKDKSRSYSITYSNIGTTKAFDGTIEEPTAA